MQAIRVIQDEHQSIAAVLHGMSCLVRETRDHGVKPDFAVLGAMIYYLDTVPTRHSRHTPIPYPVLSAPRDHRALFRRIVNLAPPPIGLGPAR